MNWVRIVGSWLGRLYNLGLGLGYLFLQSPISFLSSISMANVSRFFAAIRVEPIRDIIKNAQTFFELERQGRRRGGLGNSLELFVRAVKARVQDGEIQLFVSHEASRTGAPLIVFKIAEHFESRGNFTSIFILCKGGEIRSDFVNRFPCYMVQNRKAGPQRDQELSLLFGTLYAEFGIRSVIVNSVESLFVLHSLHASGIVNISMLVHEMGNLYDSGSWIEIEKYAKHVVFPAQFIKKKALENTPISSPHMFVRGQGLLNEDIVHLPKDPWRSRIRSELGIPEGSTMVLACGSTIVRKGVDIFSFTAISVLNNCSPESAPYFVWLGDAPSNHFMKWVEHDVNLSGHKEHIIFMGSRDISAQYFLACDIFFMTSRGDPYPCVVQEAMAAGAPIVGFHNSGGYPEMLYEDNSYLHEYGDIVGAARTLLKLVRSPELYQSKVEDTRSFAAREFDFGAYADFLMEITSKEILETQYES